MSTILRIGGALTVLSLGLQVALPSEAIALGTFSREISDSLLMAIAESEARETEDPLQADFSQYSPPPGTGAPDGTEGSGTR